MSIKKHLTLKHTDGKSTMSTQESFFDVIIVGGGIVGATAALRIAKETDLSVALIEASSHNTSFDDEAFDPRVVALSLESQHILDNINAWQAIIEQRICPYVGMQIWDGEGTGHIEFLSRDIHQDSLGAIVENSVIINALNQQITYTPSIYHLRGVSINDIAVLNNGSATQTTQLTTDEGQQLHCSLAIAADGSQSTLRELSHIKTREWSYGHTAIVTTVTTEKSHQFQAWQRFTQHGPLAFLPLTEHGGDSQRVSIVWSQTQTRAEDTMQLSDADFCMQLGREFEYRLGNIKHTGQRFAIPLVQRHAKYYVKPGIALIGDAAHAIHPLAGQGVNLGLYDADVLSAEIIRAHQRRVPLNHLSILNRYQRQRMPHNLAAMAAMEGFKRLFGADNLATRWLRNQGMHTVNAQGWLKKILSSTAAGSYNTHHHITRRASS